MARERFRAAGGLFFVLASAIVGCGAGQSSACTAETNQEFCARLARNCGQVKGTDNCDDSRTVDSCGNCSGSDDCTENVCVAPGLVARPSYNTGSGFFVANGRLYDANGAEFRIQGVNRAHYDWGEDAYASMKRANVNTVRIGLPIWLQTESVNTIQQAIDNGLVPVPGVWALDGSYTDARSVTCQGLDPADTADFANALKLLDEAVDLWIARYQNFKPFEKYMLLNIANEWGPGNSEEWSKVYINEVKRLRDAGYLCTLVVDAGGYGQDPYDIISYAKAILDADPQHNIVFDLHIYGQWASTPGETNSSGAPRPYYLPDLFDSLQGSVLPILIGEFGPGNNTDWLSPSFAPGYVITAANDHQFGWLAWAWDVTGSEYSLTTNFHYSQATSNQDLSDYGREVIENSSYGLLVTSKPASIFP